MSESAIEHQPALGSFRPTAAEQLADAIEDVQVRILNNTRPDQYSATCALLERFEQLVRKVPV